MQQPTLVSSASQNHRPMQPMWYETAPGYRSTILPYERIFTITRLRRLKKTYILSNEIYVRNSKVKKRKSSSLASPSPSPFHWKIMPIQCYASASVHLLTALATFTSKEGLLLLEHRGDKTLSIAKIMCKWKFSNVNATRSLCWYNFELTQF